MLDYARDCLAGRNLSGLLTVCAKLRQDQILDLLESALRSKKEWAWPHLTRLVEHPTSVLCVASVHGHTQCFDAVFKNINWKHVPHAIGYDLLKRCAVHNDDYGFLKVAPFVAVDNGSHIVRIAVRRNNSKILHYILTHFILTADEQRKSVVAAIEMAHEKCLDLLLPHITDVAFDDTDLRNMMHRVGTPADLLKKISHYFSKENFNTILSLACVNRNDDVVDWAFGFANASQVLTSLNGAAADVLQERMNQAQKDRISKKITNRPFAGSVRKM